MANNHRADSPRRAKTTDRDRHSVAKSIHVERNYVPDRGAMRAALRVLLGLTRVAVRWEQR